VTRCVPLIGDQLCCAVPYSGAMKLLASFFIALGNFYVSGVVMATIVVVVGAFTSPLVVPVWHCIKGHPYRDALFLVIWVTMVVVMWIIWDSDSSQPRATADQGAPRPPEAPRQLQDQRIWLQSVPVGGYEEASRHLLPPPKSLPATGHD